MNLRFGPGTVYDPPIGYLHKGDILEIIGRTANNAWIQVIPANQEIQGWIFASPKYVQVNVDLDAIPIAEVPPTPPPSYPAPVLISPENGAGVQGTFPPLYWKWDGELGEDEFFEVRIWHESITTYHPALGWVKVPYFDYNITYEQSGKFYWTVVVVKGTNAKPNDWSLRLEWPHPLWEGDLIAELSPESEPRFFLFTPYDISGPSGSGAISHRCHDPSGREIPCKGDDSGGPGNVGPPSHTLEPPTPTNTPVPTPTYIPTPTPTETPTPTPTETPTPTPTETPVPTPTETLTPVKPTQTPTTIPVPPPPPTSPIPTPLPTAAVEVQWPKKMEIDHSDSVRVSLVRITEQTFVATVERPGHTVVAVPLSPIGTPSVPIEKVFGPEYKGFATAYLAGAAFDVEPLGTAYQPLDQPQVIWEWNIVPKKTDQQLINVSIEIQWKPLGSDGEIIQRRIWSSRLDIFVEKPLIATGQLNLFALISAFIGSGLSVPWLYKSIGDIRENQRKDKENKGTYLPE
jgi:hypothetical protein